MCCSFVAALDFAHQQCSLNWTIPGVDSAPCGRDLKDEDSHPLGGILGSGCLPPRTSFIEQMAFQF